MKKNFDAQMDGIMKLIMKRQKRESEEGEKSGERK